MHQQQNTRSTQSLIWRILIFGIGQNPQEGAWPIFTQQWTALHKNRIEHDRSLALGQPWPCRCQTYHGRCGPPGTDQGRVRHSRGGDHRMGGLRIYRALRIGCASGQNRHSQNIIQGRRSAFRIGQFQGIGRGLCGLAGAATRNRTADRAECQPCRYPQSQAPGCLCRYHAGIRHGWQSRPVIGVGLSEIRGALPDRYPCRSQRRAGASHARYRGGGDPDQWRWLGISLRRKHLTI